MKKELKQAENAKITVKMAVELWLSGKRLFAKPSTYAKYVHTVRSHILPHLGEMSVAEINTGYLTEYLRMLLQEGRVDGTGGLAPKTVHDIYVIIRSILKLAEETWDTANRVSRVSNLWRRTVYVQFWILRPGKSWRAGFSKTARISDAWAFCCASIPACAWVKSAR